MQLTNLDWSIIGAFFSFPYLLDYGHPAKRVKVLQPIFYLGEVCLGGYWALVWWQQPLVPTPRT
ncbi:MAG: hypothetical protein R2795_07585 [Saprospiraceae bacterium]